MTIETAPDYRGAVEAVIAVYGRDPGFLIPMLQDVQREFGYLPAEAMRAMAELLEIPLSQCYSVATFYTSLALAPRGKHLLTLCLGTVCYLKGGRELARHVEQELRVKPGETTEDGLFTYQPVNCLGACALAPVMMVDDKYYEHVKVSQIHDILAAYAPAGEGGHNGDD
jgi:NADH-quinone oxidoreductase E subunit